MYNQRAGDLEPAEALQQAAVHETLKETGAVVTLTGIVGLSLCQAPANGVTYLRMCFAAAADHHTNMTTGQ